MTEQVVEEYIGDGVFASFDGWMVTLRAPRGYEQHFVHLEPDVLAALVRFVHAKTPLRLGAVNSDTVVNTEREAE